MSPEDVADKEGQDEHRKHILHLQGPSTPSLDVEGRRLRCPPEMWLWE